VSLDEGLLSSARCNGATIQKKKLCGKVRTSSVLAIQSLCYHREETCDCSLFLLEPFSFSNLGTIFLLRRRVVTPHASDSQGVYLFESPRHPRICMMPLSLCRNVVIETHL
jgi:hypothetical protein